MTPHVNFASWLAVTPAQLLATYFGTGRADALKSMDPLVLRSSPFDGTQLCIEEDSNLFFPEYYSDTAQVEKAKAVCDNCWIKGKCLDYAMQTPMLQGIWGGTTPRERKRLRLSKI